jgi:hypothetical protein
LDLEVVISWWWMAMRDSRLRDLGFHVYCLETSIRNLWVDEERLGTMNKDEGLMVFIGWKMMFLGLKEEGDEKGYLCHYIMKFCESIYFNPNQQCHMAKNMTHHQKSQPRDLF